MQLIACKSFTYPYGSKKPLAVGEEFSAPDNDAKVLVLTRIATPVLPAIETLEVIAADGREIPVRVKRRYRRRDMTAE